MIDVKIPAWRLVFLATAVAVAFGIVACGGSATAGAPGCEQIVHEVPGLIQPETSGLTCNQLKRLVQNVPATLGAFLLEGFHAGALWRCRLFNSHVSSRLLLCRRGKSRFSIVSSSHPKSPN